VTRDRNDDYLVALALRERVDATGCGSHHGGLARRERSQEPKPSAGLEPATPSLPWKQLERGVGAFAGLFEVDILAAIGALCGGTTGRCVTGVPRRAAGRWHSVLHVARAGAHADRRALACEARVACRPTR
jgi:hypothetical protein